MYKNIPQIFFEESVWIVNKSVPCPT